MEIDELLLPMHQYIQELINLQSSVIMDIDEQIQLYPEQMSIEMPLEMQIDGLPDQKVIIGAAPPIYYANTSIQPVYHSIRVNIGLIENELISSNL